MYKRHKIVFDSSITHPAYIHIGSTEGYKLCSSEGKIHSNAIQINIDSIHPAAMEISINKDLYKNAKCMYKTLLNK